jgi:hypothetical protein
MEKLDLAVEDLILDLANPRLGGVAGQAAALQGLVDLGIVYFRNLMLSIKANGLDPGDSFYLIADDQDPSAYIVVDGNRRLAALKALVEPAILSTLKLPAGQQRTLVKAAEDFDRNSITSVSCILFEDRASADPWIERRHGRDLAGEGRLTWSPLEIERFQKDRSTLDVIDFVERAVGLGRPDWSETRAAVEDSSSTLRRFLSSSIARQWLGYSVTTDAADGGKAPVFTRDATFVAKVLERLFDDIADKTITSRTHNNTEDLDRYFHGLPEDLHPRGEPGSPVLFRDAAAAPPPASSPAASAPKTTRAKPVRPTLSEKRHLFVQPQTTKGQRLVLEASKISVSSFPLASAFLLRALLEHTVDSYMDTHGIARSDGAKLLDLNNRAVKVIDHLVTTGKASAQQLRGAKRVLTNTTDPASIQALNDYHHDRYQVPSADVIRNGWDACVPLFVAVYGLAQ